MNRLQSRKTMEWNKVEWAKQATYEQLEVELQAMAEVEYHGKTSASSRAYVAILMALLEEKA